MRVLHVIPSVAASDGGPSRAILNIECALIAAGVEVVTATTDHRGPVDASAREAPASGAVRKIARKWFTPYKIAPGIVPWLWRNARQFDVIHIHALFSFTSLAAGVIARLRGVPYVVRPLGTLTHYGVTERRRWLKKAFVRLFDGPMLQSSAAVHFTSAAEQQEAASLGLIFRSVVIPLGVPIDGVAEGAGLAEEFPAIAGRRRLLYLSRLDPKKNLEALLHAFAALQRKRGDLILLIAGEGRAAYVAELRSLADGLGLGADAIWLGHVEGQRKARAMAAADVFVLPSFSENFGIAAAEAMMAGLPVVLAHGVALAPDAQKANIGFSVRPEAGAIAGAIERLLDDEPLRRRMGDAARVFAEREYSTVTMARRLIALYEDVSSAKVAPA
jgi:glycosyltransferase involved in cell wall biosynthesis